MPINKKLQEKVNNLLVGLNLVLDPAVQDRIFFKAVDKNEKFLIELNTIDQILNRGVLVFDFSIAPLDRQYPVYSRGYTQTKMAKGLFQGFVDLRFSGRLLRNFDLFKFKRSVLIKAVDVSVPYAEKLRRRYGQWEGWTDKNKNKAIRVLAEDMGKTIKDIILNGKKI